jgi:hypothetical protein
MAQKYGILVEWEDGVKTWVMAMSEYTASENSKPASYSSKFEAEEAARNMGMKKFSVEAVND